MQSSLTIVHLQAAGKGDVQGGWRPSESLGLIRLKIVMGCYSCKCDGNLVLTKIVTCTLVGDFLGAGARAMDR